MPIVTAVWMPAIEQWLVALPGGRDALRPDERAVEELVADEATGACVKYVIPRLVPAPKSGARSVAALSGGSGTVQRTGLPSPAPARGDGTITEAG